MTILLMLWAGLAFCDDPLPPVRPMEMAESKPLAPKAVVVGEVPECASVASLKKDVARAKGWQALYDSTWAEFGEYEKRCRSGARGGEKDLKVHLAALRADAKGLFGKRKDLPKACADAIRSQEGAVRAAMERFEARVKSGCVESPGV